jgi:hypothetical protein
MADETERDSTYEPGTTSESQHGWAPDAPGDGEAKDRAVEANQKAFEGNDTQAASRGDAQLPDYPEDVGESTTRRGEDVAAEEGKEPGRYDSGTQGESERPYGGSTARASTGVDPQEPIDESMPDLQTGDQGG